MHLKMWKSIVGCEYYESEDFSINVSKFTKNPKFAFFDLDQTLITPKNGRAPYSLHLDEDTNNFIYLGNREDILNLFQSLKAQGHIVAIITNQSRYSKFLADKIENVRIDMKEYLGWSPYIFICKNNKYLKPTTGSFKLLCKILGFEYTELNINNLRRIDKGLPSCFMVGDASGKDDPFPPYRYSSNDRDFAKNISLLLSKKYIICHYIRPIDIFGSYEIQPKASQELVIMVGNPGSGKSTGSSILQQASYKVCISDVIKDRTKMSECVKQNLEEGYSVVADATNPYKEKRMDYIKSARDLNIPVRILWYIRDGRPFNELRGAYDPILPGYKENSTYFHKKPIPEVAYSTYSKNFEEPTEDEGEIEIVF